MFAWLAQLVVQYGYAMIILFVFAEGVGVPLPGETALVMAAALAAQGRLSLVGVIAAGTLGSLLGGSGGYWIGRLGGIALLRRDRRWWRADGGGLARAQRFFERYGAPSVFLARFVALLRTVVAMLAGASRMPFGRFTLYNGLGGLAWATAVGVVGYLFGRNLPRLQRGLGRAGLAVALLVSLLTGLGLAWRWFHANRETIVARVWQLWERTAISRPFAWLRARSPRAWTFVAARFARGEYLGLHLTIGLLCSLIGLWGFAAVTEDILSMQPLTQFDVALAQWFHGHATPVGEAVCTALSAVGGPWAMTVGTSGVALLLILRRRWLMCGGWLAALAGGAVLNEAVKLVIRRPRPPYAAGYAYGFSFPSGHAMGSVVAYGMLIYLVVLATRSRAVHVVAAGAGAVLIAGIGFSRLYLGVHYFSDIVGGYAAGTVWLSACISGLEVARRREAPR
jgi:undecaprenyl-diphosphatase